jgi:hypothetical protein
MYLIAEIMHKFLLGCTKSLYGTYKIACCKSMITGLIDVSEILSAVAIKSSVLRNTYNTAI